jgi:hypothetical protein
MTKTEWELEKAEEFRQRLLKHAIGEENIINQIVENIKGR